MFVQIIEGRAADREGILRQMDRWVAELRPGATGYLGSTGGVTDDGRAVLVARFESAAAAQTNSERAEQGQWWNETEKYFDGPVAFSESTEVDQLRGGGSDDAGFVQIMKGTADRDRIRALDRQLEELGTGFRPDLLGGLRMWIGSDRYVEVAYFTGEADARAGEQTAIPPELEAGMTEFQELMADVEFIDLPEPVLTSG